jgi:type II secretory pathway pseudopilin PulG
MMKPKKLNSAGDTIVEVLIVLAVLGLALAIAAATANRGLNQSRNAEEHSQALGLIDTQVELLRNAVVNQIDVFSSSRPFCIQDSLTTVPFAGLPTNSDVPDDANADNWGLHPYPDKCVKNTYYHISVKYNSSGDYFSFKVRWDGVGSLGRQQEVLVYRTHALTPGS